MTDINKVVLSAIKKEAGLSIDELAKDISESIENRLFFDINMDLPFRIAKKAFQAKYLEELFIMAHGNVSRAAKLSRINRRQLHRLIKSLGIKTSKFRQEMRRPYDYLREDLKNVMEKRLNDYKKKDYASKVYDKMPRITESLTKQIGFQEKSFKQALNEFEKQYFTRLLGKEKNTKEAVKTAKITLRTLQRKIKFYKLGLRQKV